MMENNQEVINHEATSDISAIVAEASKDEALQQPTGAAGPSTGETVSGVPNYAAEAKGIILFAVKSLTPISPRLKDVYTEEQITELSESGGELMAYYGMTMGGIFEKYGPHIRFFSCAIPLGIQTVKAWQLDKADAEKHAVTTETPKTAMQPVIDTTAPDALHTKIK